MRRAPERVLRSKKRRGESAVARDELEGTIEPVEEFVLEMLETMEGLSGMSMRDDDERKIEDLIDAARLAALEGLVVATSGNMSVALDDGRIAITAARSWLRRVGREDIVILPLETRGSDAPSGVAGGTERRPSRETPMHLAIYRSAPHVGSVLHFQSPAATALACSADAPSSLDLIPEVPVYVRRPAWVDWLEPGSEELARAVSNALKSEETRVVQLRNHGQVAVGLDPLQAIERAAFFELACRIWLETSGRQRLFLSETARDSLYRYG